MGSCCSGRGFDRRVLAVVTQTVTLGGIEVEMDCDDPDLAAQMVPMMDQAVIENGPEILDQDIPIIIEGVQRGTIYKRVTS